ncbi:MAG: 3-phosphoshikimate 1-carboxyvinyltransferase [Sphingobacteriales bacterium JAD_PAG50586_3]|nr:MAG: 3-phosphoshikimate 1-carboxyvinyltransferase [Sphingobacteriales bacterium JAD_PAG50586_3]
MIRITHPTKVVKGSITLPTSKSISNRALIIQALCEEPFTIKNLSEAEDTQVLKHILDSKPAIADVGDAGTAMRFLLAYYATQPNGVTLTGSARMKERPIGPLVDALRSMGAEITYLEKEGYPPVMVKGSRNLNNRVTIRSNISSQFISALMLIGPAIKGGLRIVLDGPVTSSSYIDLTYNVMYFMDADIEMSEDGKEIIIEAVEYEANYFVVEPDWSAASYFFEIAALAKSTDIVLENLPILSNQGDSGIVDLYEAVFDLQCSAEGKSIRIKKQARPLGIADAEFDFTEMPDMAQTIAATAAAVGVEFMLTGLKTLRIKETDRINALKNELEKLGVGVEVGDDWIKINPPLKATGDLQFNTYNDHRMAMALAPLALVADSVTIDNAAVVNKSFPGYWNELRKLGFIINPGS